MPPYPQRQTKHRQSCQLYGTLDCDSSKTATAVAKACFDCLGKPVWWLLAVSRMERTALSPWRMPSSLKPVSGTKPAHMFLATGARSLNRWWPLLMQWCGLACFFWLYLIPPRGSSQSWVNHSGQESLVLNLHTFLVHKLHKISKIF